MNNDKNFSIMKVLFVIGLLFGTILFSGCSKTEKTVVGAAIGAGTGAAIGSAAGNTEGAVVGGVAGGILGGVIGNKMGDDK